MRDMAITLQLAARVRAELPKGVAGADTVPRIARANPACDHPVIA